MSRDLGPLFGKFVFRMREEKPNVGAPQAGSDDPAERPGIDGLEGGGGGSSLPGAAALGGGDDGSSPDTAGLGGGEGGPSLP